MDVVAELALPTCKTVCGLNPFNGRLSAYEDKTI